MFTPLVLLACSPEHQQQVQDLEAARSAWEEHRPAAYGYTYDDEGMLHALVGAVAIDVEDREVVLSTVIDTGEKAPDQWWLSIDDLFDEIESVIEGRPSSLDVEYDAELGIPTTLHAVVGENMGDGGWDFETYDFASHSEE